LSNKTAWKSDGYGDLTGCDAGSHTAEGGAIQNADENIHGALALKKIKCTSIAIGAADVWGKTCSKKIIVKIADQTLKSTLV
jgi:hypothetical protein